MPRSTLTRGSDDPLAPLWVASEAVAGIRPEPGQVKQFRRYLELVMKWNRAQRLTGPQSPDAIVRELFQDSVLFLSKIPEGPIRLADIGSGAGIPGVPIRILRPDIRTTLVESKRKRVSFLSAVKRELALTDVTIFEGRADSVLDSNRGLEGSFDVVLSRGVGVSLFETAVLYLKPGGLYVSGAAPGTGDSDTAVGTGLSAETIRVTKLGLVRTVLIGRRPE